MSDTDVWDLYERLWKQPRLSLNDTQQRIAAVCDLRQEVAADGFDAYFRYWGGDSAPTALVALPSILGSDWATVLREAMSLFGRPYPMDCDERAEIADDEGVQRRLDQLEERFSELEAATDADATMQAYLDRHPEAF